MPVFKFVEQPENNEKPEKSKLKFKIMSLKVKGVTDYIPELVGFNFWIAIILSCEFDEHIHYGHEHEHVYSWWPDHDWVKLS